MAVVPPNNKAFLDIELVQECMDMHAQRIAISFGEYLRANYRQSTIDDYWYNVHNDPHQLWSATTKYIYNQFIESININNQHGE